MGNRFGAKDVLLFGVLAAILVSIWLTMVQIDRQWALIARNGEQLNDQARDIAEIRRRVSGGLVSSAANESGTSPDSSSWRGFTRAPQAQQQPGYTEGDWLIDYFPDNLQSLTPILSSDSYATQVQQRVLDTLITRDPQTLEWLPLVAESWKIGDDGLTIRFKIRPGVSFADGEPLTAEDVAFSLQRVVKLNKTPAFIFTQFGWSADNVDSMVVANDESTVTLTINANFSPGLVLNALSAGVGSVVDKKLVLENEKDGDLGYEWLKNHSAGSGPAQPCLALGNDRAADHAPDRRRFLLHQRFM